MKLFLADRHLESARLTLGQEQGDPAREHCEAACQRVETCGYRRRNGELEEIRVQLGGAGT